MTYGEKGIFIGSFNRRRNIEEKRRKMSFPRSDIDRNKKKAKSASQWHEIKDWSNADFPLYWTVLDTTLQKISVAFTLLQANVQRNIQETKIQANALCAQITHAPLTAVKAVISVSKIRKGNEIPGFSKNQELVKACHDAKFWFLVWRESGRPKSRVLNFLHVHTKRKF